MHSAVSWVVAQQLRWAWQRMAGLLNPLCVQWRMRGTLRGTQQGASFITCGTLDGTESEPTHMNRLPFHRPTSSSTSQVGALCMLTWVLLSSASRVRVQPYGVPYGRHDTGWTWHPASRGLWCSSHRTAGCQGWTPENPLLLHHIDSGTGCVWVHSTTHTWCSHTPRQMGGRQWAYRRGCRLARWATAMQSRAYQPTGCRAPAEQCRAEEQTLLLARMQCSWCSRCIAPTSDRRPRVAMG